MKKTLGPGRNWICSLEWRKGREAVPLFNDAALSRTAAISCDTPEQVSLLMHPDDSTGTCFPLCPLVTPDTSSRAQHTARPNKLKHQSLEQRKFYCKGQAMRTGCSWSKTLTPWWLWWKRVSRQNFRWGLQGVWLSFDFFFFFFLVVK